MGKGERAIVVLASLGTAVGLAWYFRLDERIKDWITSLNRPPQDSHLSPVVTISTPTPGQKFDATITSIHIAGSAMPSPKSHSPIATLQCKVTKKSTGVVVMDNLIQRSDTGLFQTTTPQLNAGDYEAVVIATDDAGQMSQSRDFPRLFTMSKAGPEPTPDPGPTPTPTPGPVARIGIDIERRMLAINPRLLALTRGIRTYTDAYIISYFASHPPYMRNSEYRRIGSTGFTDMELRLIEQVANDRLIELWQPWVSATQ